MENLPVPLRASTGLLHDPEGFMTYTFHLLNAWIAYSCREFSECMTLMHWRLIRAKVWVDEVLLARYKTTDVENHFQLCHNVETETQSGPSALTNLARQRIFRTYDTYAVKANKGLRVVFLARYDSTAVFSVATMCGQRHKVDLQCSNFTSPKSTHWKSSDILAARP
jgi:hypothetical protein